MSIAAEADHPTAIPFTKGHGTENDFLLLPDFAARLELTPARVAALCDRRRGLGADGVLRIARAEALRDAGVLSDYPNGVDAADWFLDYRNADGSLAEMCGNGVRVFAHYLLASGVESRRSFTVGTHAGARPVLVHRSDHRWAEVSVAMGAVRRLGESRVTISGQIFTGSAVDAGNPHLACVVPGLTPAELGRLSLVEPPDVDSELFPSGVNVEILTPVDSTGAVTMRVWERGVGETRSCGTGTVAAAAAALWEQGKDNGQVTVHVPGGVLSVDIAPEGAHLRGPSVLVASGTIDTDWWHDLGRCPSEK